MAAIDCFFPDARSFQSDVRQPPSQSPQRVCMWEISRAKRENEPWPRMLAAYQTPSVSWRRKNVKKSEWDRVRKSETQCYRDCGCSEMECRLQLICTTLRFWCFNFARWWVRANGAINNLEQLLHFHRRRQNKSNIDLLCTLQKPLICKTVAFSSHKLACEIHANILLSPWKIKCSDASRFLAILFIRSKCKRQFA